MLEKIETTIVQHRRLLQALFFGFVEMSGLLLYANANSFQAYSQPHQLQLSLLGFILTLMFTTLYLIRTNNRTDLTTRLIFGATILSAILGTIKLPLLVNVINLLLLLVLILLYVLPNLFLNEFGMFMLALLLASQVSGNFLLTHAYLSAGYLTTMVLPMVTYFFFFLPTRYFQNAILPSSLAVIAVIWLFYTQRSLILALVAVVVLGAWLLVQHVWHPSLSRGLLLAAILQTVLFSISR